MIAVLLAAGSSKRFENGHKLLASLDFGTGPQAVVAHAHDALCDAFLTPPLVVLGPRADEIRATLGDGSRTILNERHALGMGTSIAAAARWVSTNIGPRTAIHLALGDMPLVDPATHRAVAAGLGDAPDAVARAWIVGSSTFGHPITLGAGWLPVLETLDADVGLREHLRNLPVAPVPVEGRTQLDVDTRAALAIAAGAG